MYDIEESGKRLRKLRELTGKTQQEVAQAIGISEMTISRLERGVKGASADMIEQLREYYGTTAEYIISGNSNPLSELSIVLNSLPENKRILVEKIILGILELVKL